ncbi:MAG: Wzt carbohydrate-binding domain-containing protein, partial [Chloroflexota bacterium]|nr:Wzt carbohydrate-binding domain-containing protein [Chloroflexota bacterium]
HYSSGMFLRLAFSVAAHLEPDILVVDEVLAVGDAEFQRKCLGKVHDVSAEGRTVLLVSHNLAAVTGLCARAVWLDQGSVSAIGETEEVVRRYLAASEAGAGGDLAERRDREGTGRLRFTAFRVEGADGAPAPSVMSGDSVRLVAEYAAEPGVRDVTARFQLANSLGHVVLTFWTEATGQRFEHAPERGRIVVEAPRLPLLADHYTVTLWASVQGHTADQIDAGYIDVADGDFYGTGKSMQGHRHGVFQVEHSWRIE